MYNSVRYFLVLFRLTLQRDAKFSLENKFIIFNMDAPNNSNVDRIMISNLHKKETRTNILRCLSHLGFELGTDFKNLKKAPGFVNGFITFDSNEQANELFAKLSTKLINGTLKLRSNAATIEMTGPYEATPAPVTAPALSGPAPYQDMPYDEQLVLKAKTVRKGIRGDIKSAFKKQCPAWLADTEVRTKVYSVPHITPSPKLTAYRNKTDLTFGFDDEGKVCVGMTRPYAAGNIIDAVSKFKLMPVKAVEVADEVAKYFSDKQWTDVYSKKTQEGYWRALRLRLPENGVAIFTIETHDGPADRVIELAKHLDAFAEQKWGEKCGFWHKINRTANDALENHDSDWNHLFGPKTTTEIVLGTKFTISPLSFFQCNTSATEKLFSRVTEIVESYKPTIAIDCCCGAGAIGCILAKNLSQSIRVVGVDIVPSAIEDAVANAALNDLSDRTTWLCGPAETKLPEVFSACAITPEDNVVAVLDPPRAGLHPKAIRMLRENEAINKIVYVSCSPNSLGRDLLKLLEESEKSRAFKIIEKEAFDLFPDTVHVEAIVVLERASAEELVMQDTPK